MSENRIKWHKYPQEKPNGSDHYVATIKNGQRKIVEILFAPDGLFYVPHGYEVIAWAELPEPYKEE